MVSNTDNVINSRDIIERIEELTKLKEAVEDAREELESLEEGAVETWAHAVEVLQSTTDDFDEGAQDELVALEALQTQCDYGDWQYGETLIHEDYFTEYAQDLADDIGAIDRNANRPCNYIDWGAAADALKQDYNEVDFNGATYYIRA